MNFVPRRIALALSLAGVAFFNTTTARRDSWEEAIRRVEASAREYHDYAVEVGGTGWAGAMYSNYHSDRHQCAILGRILGQEEAIAHLEELEYPPLGPESDPHELLVFSISLENWVGAARRGGCSVRKSTSGSTTGTSTAWAGRASRTTLQRGGLGNLDRGGEWMIRARSA